MAENIDKIRQAIHTNRGGHGTASDSQIRTIWRSLTPDTQKEYLESIKTKDKSTKGKGNADNNGQKSKLSGGPGNRPG